MRVKIRATAVEFFGAEAGWSTVIKQTTIVASVTIMLVVILFGGILTLIKMGAISEEAVLAATYLSARLLLMLAIALGAFLLAKLFKYVVLGQAPPVQTTTRQRRQRRQTASIDRNYEFPTWNEEEDDPQDQSSLLHFAETYEPGRIEEPLYPHSGANEEVDLEAADYFYEGTDFRDPEARRPLLKEATAQLQAILNGEDNSLPPVSPHPPLQRRGSNIGANIWKHPRNSHIES